MDINTVHLNTRTTLNGNIHTILFLLFQLRRAGLTQRPKRHSLHQFWFVLSPFWICDKVIHKTAEFFRRAWHIMRKCGHCGIFKVPWDFWSDFKDFSKIFSRNILYNFLKFFLVNFWIRRSLECWLLQCNCNLFAICAHIPRVYWFKIFSTIQRVLIVRVDCRCKNKHARVTLNVYCTTVTRI